jgi:DNA repair exonuclease SbcCD ATPase subunit
MKHNELIETIKVEEDIKIIFDIYIRMVGKNGITKLIMKSVMPMINSELDRLLNGVVLFKLRVDINDKQEVDFLLHNVEKDIEYPINEGSGLEKTISSLALRCVMSKVSCLPKPNLIVFDECFGKVANVNLEYIGEFFQKCSEMFPNIFIISHNPLVKDWSKNILTVVKKDDVSSLTLT